MPSDLPMSLLPGSVMGRAERRRRGMIGTPPARARRKFALDARNGAGQQATDARHPPSASCPPERAPEVPAWRTDPELAARVEEPLATLTLKRRRFVLDLIDHGNQRRAVVTAGYNCKSPKTATEIGQQLLADPYVQHAYQALLEARGLS